MSSENAAWPTPSSSPSNLSFLPSLLRIDGLRDNIAETMDQCIAALEASGLPTFPEQRDGQLWCNATWDTVLCWPATTANTSVSLKCPPLKGLDPTKNITKTCHWSGRWMSRNGPTDDLERPHGWTNFTMCFTQEVIDIMRNLNNGSLTIAQDIARNARKLEFVGLGLSLLSLIISIFIFTAFRRLRVFRNMLHLHLMIAILMVVIIRLVLYVDLIFTDLMGHQHITQPEGKTINTMVVVCETMFFLLEYFKTAAFVWMFLEGFYLHNQLVFSVFGSEPRLRNYILWGYGFPLFHTCGWLAAVLYKKQGNVERCLGSYYLEPEFWILDGPRMIELVINLIFICNVIRVLWSKVGQTHNSSETDRMKKSVKAALMLIPLLGIPNIMQTIPFSPTHENITYFAIWTYLASFTYMFQGLMITIIYCFTNKEVQSAVRSCYTRFKLQHTSSHDLRRGSRSMATYYQANNGNVTTQFESEGGCLSGYSKGKKPRDSHDSTSNLVPPVRVTYRNPLTEDALQTPCFDYVNNNGVAKATERTPLNARFVDDIINGSAEKWVPPRGLL
uniref:Calcitonin receptor-like protein 1 n=1 Tax=Steinernema glaseri TaxID=37863 RepID=A0A1I7YBB0_9BILA